MCPSAFDLDHRRTTPLDEFIFRSDDLTALREKMFLLKQDAQTPTGLAKSTSWRGPFGQAANCSIQDRLVVRLRVGFWKSSKLPFEISEHPHPKRRTLRVCKPERHDCRVIKQRNGVQWVMLLKLDRSSE